jgi:hypothetical protein
MTSKSKAIVITTGLLIEVLFVHYRVLDTGPAQAVIKYMVVYGAAFILLGVAYFMLRGQELSRFFFIAVLVFSFIFGMTLVTAMPDQSDDIYRYLWDGKLQYYHINPYTFAPDDPALKEFHSDMLPRLVNFPEIKTIYPPLAQMVFRVSYTLFGESVSGMKFLFLLFMLGSSWLFYLILTGKGDRRIFLFFAWNPLVVMETSINGHLDILMVFFLLLFLLFFLKERWVLSGIALALSVLSKLIPVIVVPLVFIYLVRLPKKNLTTKPRGAGFLKDTKDTKGLETIKEWIRESGKLILRFFGPMIGVIAAFYLLYFKSAQNMFLTAVNYGTKWYFNNPVFMVLLEVFKSNRTAHFVSFSIFILIYLFILLKSMSIEKKLFYVFFAFVLMNPALHPWYIMVLLLLLCIHRSYWVMGWSGMVAFAYIVVYQYKLTGTWVDSWFVMTIEYLPLLILSIVTQPGPKGLKQKFLGVRNPFFKKGSGRRRQQR